MNPEQLQAKLAAIPALRPAPKNVATTRTQQAKVSKATSAASSTEGNTPVAAVIKSKSTAKVSDALVVWAADTGQELFTLDGHTDIVSSVAFSPDGKRIASASGDRTVKMWDAATGQQMLSLNGHSYAALSVAFSPDGSRLASTSGSLGKFGELMLVDTATGKQTLTLTGHTLSVTSVSFSSNGKWLASASWDRMVKVWDARTWTPKLRAEAQARGYLTVRRDRVKSLEELQAYIRSDKTISDMVRKQALDWAELFWKNRQTVAP